MPIINEMLHIILLFSLHDQKISSSTSEHCSEYSDEASIKEKPMVTEEERTMIDVFEGLDGPHDEAAADAKAAEDVFKGLDMVLIKF